MKQNDITPQEGIEISRKPKKKHRKRRTAAAVLGVCVLLLAAYSGGAVYALHRLQYEQTKIRDLTESIAEYDPDVRNILLIGTDPEVDGDSANCVLLLSISRRNHRFVISSFLPDSYVSIPRIGAGKLDKAYPNGGTVRLMDTVCNNFGIQTDSYIQFDFSAFVGAADALGGIQIQLSDSEAEEMNAILETQVNPDLSEEPADDLLPSGGVFRLNGKQTLAYLRICGDGKAAQVSRQREVARLLLENLSGFAPQFLIQLIRGANGNIRTNCTGQQLFLDALTLPFKKMTYDITTLSLPAEEAYTQQTTADGQEVLSVDFDKNLQVFRRAVSE